MARNRSVLGGPLGSRRPRNIGEDHAPLMPDTIPGGIDFIRAMVNTSKGHLAFPEVEKRATQLPTWAVPQPGGKKSVMVSLETLDYLVGYLRERNETI